MKKTAQFLFVTILIIALSSGCMLLGGGGPSSDGTATTAESDETAETGKAAGADESDGSDGAASSESEESGEQKATETESAAVANVKKVYIGISDFDIHSKDETLQALADDIPQTLTRAFVNSRYIKPVDRQEFDKIFEEIKLSMSGISDEKTAVEAGKVIGAEYILLGSFIKLGNQVKITCRMVRTETSEIVYTTNVKGTYEQLFDLEEVLAEKIESYVSEIDSRKT